MIIFLFITFLNKSKTVYNVSFGVNLASHIVESGNFILILVSIKKGFSNNSSNSFLLLEENFWDSLKFYFKIKNKLLLFIFLKYFCNAKQSFF